MKVKSKIFYWYAAFVLAYLLLTLLPAPDTATLAKYHLSPLGLRLLDVTFVIPLMVIWFAAFYGYRKLHAYSQLIKNNKDGKQVARLSTGLLILAIGLPLNSIVSGILSLVARHNPSFTAGAAVITNYTNVIYPLLAFLFISAAARGLSTISKTRPPLISMNVVVLVVIILGVVFCDLIAHSHDDLRQTYHLTYSLVMLTLAIPYMYIWFLGLFAVMEIFQYSRGVAGIVYRQSWRRLALGLAAIIVVEIVLQYLSTLSNWLNRLSLSGVLMLLYVLLLLLAGAYIVVASGTKKLMKIEEV